jgi:hypothetical protein
MGAHRRQYRRPSGTFPVDTRGSFTFMITAANGVSLSVKSRRLGKARVGRRYRWQLKAYLGTTPYHWKKIHGRLPRGIRLTPGGKLHGKPRHRGVYRFTVRATDSTRPRMTATAGLVLRVRKR